MEGESMGGKNFKQKEDEDKILLMEEIRRSPVEMVNSPLFIGFYTSQVVHPRSHCMTSTLVDFGSQHFCWC